jgi:trehalose-6-phosphate synthase
MAEGERERRLEAIRERVRSHDLEWWIGVQLSDFDAAAARRRAAATAG